MGLLIVLGGCEQQVLRPSPPDTGVDQQRDLFGPAKMRLHPIFTQIKNWTGGTSPDGIEAVVEFDDRFGDSSKAAGALVFELYAFRSGFPDPRGERLVEPWTASLSSVDQQQAHWRREIGAYSFLLADGDVRTDRNYVLTATFEPLSGPRIFSQLILSANGRQLTPSTTQPDLGPLKE